jgi:hypothetical protein
MPEVHLPKVGEHSGKSIGHILLEVVLISAGVFLGLMGEQWRENRHHRELAEQALRRFKTELTSNRTAVAGVKDYHLDRLKELRAYFDATPDGRKSVSLQLTKSANPAFLDRTAWDLALATQSLSYIDSDLAFALSGIYNVQSALSGEAEAFMAGMFTRPPAADQTTYLAALQAYFGDMSFFEPKLLTMYDEALQKIEKALGDH